MLKVTLFLQEFTADFLIIDDINFRHHHLIMKLKKLAQRFFKLRTSLEKLLGKIRHQHEHDSDSSSSEENESYDKSVEHDELPEHANTQQMNTPSFYVPAQTSMPVQNSTGYHQYVYGGVVNQTTGGYKSIEDRAPFLNVIKKYLKKD